MGFPRQEYWSGLPFPSPEDLPEPGIEPGSPALKADALPPEPPRKPKDKYWAPLFPKLIQICYNSKIIGSMQNFIGVSGYQNIKPGKATTNAPLHCKFPEPQNTVLPTTGITELNSMPPRQRHSINTVWLTTNLKRLGIQWYYGDNFFFLNWRYKILWSELKGKKMHSISEDCCCCCCCC